MEVYLKRSIRGLEASDDASADVLRKIGQGDIVKVNITKPRNLVFHRKYWALVNLVWQNSDVYKSPEAVHVALKLAIGHYEVVCVRGTGEAVCIPKSIRFGSMDETEFAQYWTRCCDAIAKDFLPGTGPKELEEEIQRCMS